MGEEDFNANPKSLLGSSEGHTQLNIFASSHYPL
jgi:hypothetical protein